MRLLAAALLVIPLLAQTLQQQVDRILRSSTAARQAMWGIQAVDAATGRTLLAVNAHRLFRPASNAKLFTAAWALETLGPMHSFVTTVIAASRPDDSGRVAGDLVFVGGADPSLSAPPAYKKGAPAGDPLEAVEQIAAQVINSGVRRVDGDIVGDDTLFPWEPYPDGWTVDDSTWNYGAPVSALMVSDGAVTVRVVCRENGRPSLTLLPPLEYFVTDLRVRCARPGTPELRLERSGEEVRIAGAIPAAGAEWAVAVDDPAKYAAYALRDALLRRGVTVRGQAVARHRLLGEPYAAPSGFEVARRTSPPLPELLRTLLKLSQNQHAEILLRETARVAARSAALEDAVEARGKWLESIGIPAAGLVLADGSGLARQNLVTPGAVVALLMHMARSQRRDEWLSLLPVGGEDGTLEDRFAGNPEARRIRAKTGTLSAVSGLSGYIDRRRGGRVAFSILVNNYAAPAKEIRAVVDQLALALAR